jgi:hypothetical protein
MIRPMAGKTSPFLSPHLRGERHPALSSFLSARLAGRTLLRPGVIFLPYR